jgi:hypothetical protein
MSLIWRRPPGLSTRRISRIARVLSGTRFSTPLLVTASTDWSGSGICSVLPAMISTLVTPAAAMLLASFARIASVRSSAYTLPFRSHASRGEDRVGARAAANVEHDVARAQHSGGEGITDAGEGFDRGHGQCVELGRRIADEFGRPASGREMEGMRGAVGDLGVHVLHGLEDGLALVADDSDHVLLL